MKSAITCILNGKSGSQNEAAVRAAVARFAAEYGREARIILASGKDLEAIARKAAETGGVVAAGGGDGTISAVAAAVVDSQATLGVLPLGTLNHFAKDMGIPLDLDDAVRTVFTGSEMRVDVGEVNGRIFVNNSSVGFYPHIVRARDQQQRRGTPKWLAFAQAVLRVARRKITVQVWLEGDGQGAHKIDTPFVFVGNNQYTLTGTEIGTRARLDGGTLWLCTAPAAGRAKLLRLAIGALFGQADANELTRLELRNLQIHTHHRSLLVARDGEVGVMQTPLKYRIWPRALRVLVPNSALRVLVPTQG